MMTNPIEQLRTALMAYGRANDVPEKDVEAFAEACFEHIDVHELQEYAFTDDDRVSEAQIALIEERYPGCDYNLGWAVLDGEDELQVSTKIYTEGRPILTSTLNRKTKEITHEWE